MTYLFNQIVFKMKFVRDEDEFIDKIFCLKLISSDIYAE